MAAAVPCVYDGYDPGWILGRDKGPPVEPKPKPPPPPPPPKKEPGPIELKAPFCCEKCQEEMFFQLIDLEGVDSVKLAPEEEKVTVTGKVKPEDCLKKAKKVVRRADFWPKKKEEPKKPEEAKKK